MELQHFIDNCMISPVGAISNKAEIKPSDRGGLIPRWDKHLGWHRGYPFKQFLADCYRHLGVAGGIGGVQQLIHHYYLQNGRIDAQATAGRINVFIGGE